MDEQLKKQAVRNILLFVGIKLVIYSIIRSATKAAYWAED